MKKLSIIEKNFIKDNFINLAKHHKKYCEGESCNISLTSMFIVLEYLNIKLTKEERLLFA